MSYKYLLKQRVYNSAFTKRGRHNVALIEAFAIRDGESLKIVFEFATSVSRQGIWMMTDRGLRINGQLCPQATLWQDTSPGEIVIECYTTDGVLSLYNIWDDGRGTQSQSYSSGMIAEDLANGTRYRCNDIGFETEFDKLVFRIERLV